MKGYWTLMMLVPVMHSLWKCVELEESVTVRLRPSCLARKVHAALPSEPIPRLMFAGLGEFVVGNQILQPFGPVARNS